MNLGEVNLRKGAFNNILLGHLDKCIETPKFEYTGLLLIRGVQYPILLVKSVVRDANYDNDLFESTRVLIALPASTRNIALVKGFDEIEFALITRVNNRLISKKTYHVVLQDVSNNDMAAATKELVDAEQLDLKSIGWVVLELYDKVAWALRRRQIGYIPRDTTPIDAIRYILAQTTLTGDNDASDSVYAIDYHEEEQKHYKSILIPETLSYLDVFDYIHNYYGVYSRGFGIFLFNRSWEIYRPYDSDKFDEGGKRLIIYNVPSDDMQSLEKNFYIEGDVTYLAATGKSVIKDQLSEVGLNEGTGIRFGDIRALEGRMSDGSEVRPDKYLAQVNMNNRPDGVFAPITPESFTDNPKKMSSDLRKKRGVIVTVKWENGIYANLVPGMGVKFIYPVMDKIKQVNGTLLGAVEHSTIEGNGIMEKTHSNTIALTLMIFPYG